MSFFKVEKIGIRFGGVVAVDDVPTALVLQAALGAGGLPDAEQATDAKGLHYRVWPDWHQHGGTPPNYYEACTPRAFARCFERI